MKSKTIVLIIAGVLLASSKAPAVIYITSPPGNIVQNGTFQAYFDDWTGLEAIVENGGEGPYGWFGLGGDIYQDLPTTPGQQYTLDFYAAADLYFGPSLTLEVALNSQPLVSITTPPYTYNGGVNRYAQMQWQEYTYSFTGSSSTTRLELIDQNTYDFGLASVSVVPVPEPPTTWFILVAVAVALYCAQRRRQAKPNTALEPTPTAP